MNDAMKRIPVHPFLVAIFPPLAMLASNIREVNLDVVGRSLIIVTCAITLFFLILRIITREWRLASLLASFFTIWFYAYGHIYEFLGQNPIGSINLGRHRYLLTPYILVLGIGIFLIIKYRKRNINSLSVINLICLMMLIYPLFYITYYSISTRLNSKQIIQLTADGNTLQISETSPDIYYIILDSYTRNDALLQDLGFNNSEFTDKLRNLGFYVAECSRSNYSSTISSLTSSLNFNYLENIGVIYTDSDTPSTADISFIKHNKVRYILEKMGYYTIAFYTGYEWSVIDDARLYLRPEKNYNNTTEINPFEALLLRSTILLVFSDSQSHLFRSYADSVNYPYQGHVRRQLFIFDTLPKIPDLVGHKFVFVHILIPHIPYIFGPNGEILTDTGFYGGKKSTPINEKYLRDGYTGQIQFLNKKIIEIVSQIIKKSNHPPVIILQGDHGLRRENRLKIFNAYYVPENGVKQLYPNITPVNTFRLILKYYFGYQIDLLPDNSYLKQDILNPVPEDNPNCLP